LSFQDGSHAVLVSRALQENLICMANILEYLDVSNGIARLSFRRSKREQLSFESTARVTAILRYLLLGHRMTGKTPAAPAVLDRRSFDFAGKMAAGAVMFVVAHEMAHIVYRHEASSTTQYVSGSDVTVDELQEAQADVWAFNFLKELMADDPAPKDMALWCAFVGLIATQITEQAIYVRRNRTHPEAWVRWGTLEKVAGKSEKRVEDLRVGLLAAVAGALQLDQPFPERLWPPLWQDQLLCVEPGLTHETLQRWDQLHTGPLDSLTAEAECSATVDGKTLLEALRRGEMSAVFGPLVTSRRLARMLDPNSALMFFTLRDAIDDAPTVFTEGDRALFSVVGARLAAQHLTSGELHG
jgi:hypothetical protein